MAVLTVTDETQTGAGAGASAGGEGTDASSGDATMDQQETAEKRTEEERTIEGSKGKKYFDRCCWIRQENECLFQLWSCRT